MRDDVGDRRVAWHRELILAARHLSTQEHAVDPAPLDVRQVVHDPEQRDELVAVGAPARLVLGSGSPGNISVRRERPTRS